jgi:hypothetical protein
MRRMCGRLSLGHKRGSGTACRESGIDGRDECLDCPRSSRSGFLQRIGRGTRPSDANLAPRYPHGLACSSAPGSVVDAGVEHPWLHIIDGRRSHETSFRGGSRAEDSKLVFWLDIPGRMCRIMPDCAGLCFRCGGGGSYANMPNEATLSNRISGLASRRVRSGERSG